MLPVVAIYIPLQVHADHAQFRSGNKHNDKCFNMLPNSNAVMYMLL